MNETEKTHKIRKRPWTVLIIVVALIIGTKICIGILSSNGSGEQIEISEDQYDNEYAESEDIPDSIYESGSSIPENEMNDEGNKSRQKEFEKIVKTTAKSYNRIKITSINGGTVKFKWKTKKGKTDLFIAFDIDPDEIAWCPGWRPMEAYGPDPISFADEICNQLDELE